MNLSQMEINAIRECVGCSITSSTKLSSYASKASEPEIKEIFKQASLRCEQSAQKLLHLL